MKNSAFVDYILHDLLCDLPNLTARAMFGGYGLYQGNIIFAIVVDDQLYLKVGDENRSLFEKSGSEPFSYTNAQGKKVAMSYWLVPEGVLESRDQLIQWALRSVAVSSARRKKR